jgi:glyoxylase-like metal-dependent hydrolase (beta-lactamase superfamily II)
MPVLIRDSNPARSTVYQWLDHSGDGHRVGPSVWLMLTPGHTSQDLSVIVETANGVVACIHSWWHTDRTPEVDPLAEDQAALETSRQRILATADRVVAVTASRSRQADPAERLLPGRAQAAFANPSSRAVHPC